ncbi:MAG: hypothetical protein IPM08_14070 [Actinomycetales bacterium]|nr:hypothetical protein [Actinomycetales bacterium]
MAPATDAQAISKKATTNDLVKYVVEQVGLLGEGKNATIDFLDRAAVGEFCRALGFAAERNWAALPLDEISPEDETGAKVVPADEAAKILACVKVMFSRGKLAPSDEGTPAPHILNDFLPAGTTYRGKKCLGHLWEWQYALAVELEHGRYRGTNVTNNHPVLTALVVLAHLSEDALYYARLWVMETEGELLNAQLDRTPFAELHETLEVLQRAEQHKAQRIAEKVAAA